MAAASKSTKMRRLRRTLSFINSTRRRRGTQYNSLTRHEDATRRDQSISPSSVNSNNNKKLGSSDSAEDLLRRLTNAPLQPSSSSVDVDATSSSSSSSTSFSSITTQLKQFAQQMSNDKRVASKTIAATQAINGAMATPRSDPAAKKKSAFVNAANSAKSAYASASKQPHQLRAHNKANLFLKKNIANSNEFSMQALINSDKSLRDYIEKQTSGVRDPTEIQVSEREKRERGCIK